MAVIIAMIYLGIAVFLCLFSGMLAKDLNQKYFRKEYQIKNGFRRLNIYQQYVCLHSPDHYLKSENEPEGYKVFLAFMFINILMGVSIALFLIELGFPWIGR